MMNFISITKLVKILIITVTICVHGNYAFAHGGKTHGANMVTPFVIVQKATGLFDKLISEGKLNNAWETDLKTITVYSHQRGDKTEWVVKFLRTKGNPEAVYIFFDTSGKYIGSNFTGK